LETRDTFPFSWLWAPILGLGLLLPVLAGSDPKEAGIQIGFYLLLFTYSLRLFETKKYRGTTQDVLFLLVVLYTGLTVFWSSVPDVAVEHLKRFLPGWGFYLLLRQGGGEAQEKTLWRTLTIGTGILVLYGLLQKFGIEFIPDYVKWRSDFAPFATFGYPDLWATFLVLAWPFLLFSNRWDDLKNGAEWRTLLAGAMALGIFLTQSTAGAFGLAAQTLLGILWVRRKSRGQITSPAKAVGILAILLFLGVAWGVRQTHDFHDRALVWKAAGQMFWDAPLVGWGANHFPVHFRAYQPDALAEKIAAEPDFAKRVHNDLLETAVELGLAGLVLIAWFWGRLVRKTWESPDLEFLGPWPGFLALAGAGTASLFSEAFRLPGVTAFIWAGAAWWANRCDPAPERVGKAPIARTLGLLLAFAAAGRSYQVARTAYTEMFVPVPNTFMDNLPADLPGRAAQLEKLILDNKGKPDEWTYRHEMGNVFTKMGRLQDAENQFREAILLNPQSDSSYVNLGNVYVMESKEDAKLLESAIYCYQHVLQVHPEDLEARFNLAYAYFLGKRMSDALRELDEVLKRQPSHPKALQLKRIIVP